MEEASAGASHPAPLVGYWVRRLDDRTWGDTLEFSTDGIVKGTNAHFVPPSARWWVRQGAVPEYCAGDAEHGGYCRTYRLRGDTLVLDGGPAGKTLFRRVSGSAPVT